jgi:hypothetical protein
MMTFQPFKQAPPFMAVLMVCMACCQMLQHVASALTPTEEDFRKFVRECADDWAGYFKTYIAPDGLDFDGRGWANRDGYTTKVGYNNFVKYYVKVGPGVVKKSSPPRVTNTFQNGTPLCWSKVQAGIVFSIAIFVIFTISWQI